MTSDETRGLGHLPLDTMKIVTVLIPLPLFHNPGAGGHAAPMEEDKFETTASEITQQFGGCTLFLFRDSAPRGYWWSRGVLFRDVHAVLEVDVPDTPEARDWLKTYARTVLIPRFAQKAIYLKFVGPVEALVIDEEVAAD